MRTIDTHAPSRPRAPWPWTGIRRGLMWGSLLPLLAVMRPYGGLVQDARIYIGRGIADRDPDGLGRDILFSDDAQTGFTALRWIVRGLLTALSPERVSMLLAAVGLSLWLAAAVALARRLAPGRAGWAVAVAMLVLPADYGAFGAFGYAEAIATPRVFAEAAVLAALAATLGHRPAIALACLLMALALHPLMALAGLAVALAILVAEDRRWLLALALGLAAILGAAALRLPLADRLFQPLDPVWLAILRQRSSYLFPTLWPAASFGRIACGVAATVIAGNLSTGRVRVLLWSIAGVALGGVATSLLVGDLWPSVLLTQVQPWRALWLLAVGGNAGLCLAGLGLWRMGPGGRLALAVLILAWCSDATPSLALPLALAAVGLQILARRGRLPIVSPGVARAGIAASLAVALCDMAVEGGRLVALFRSMGDWVAQSPWPYVATSGVLGAPALALALSIALAPSARLRRPAVGVAGLAVVAALGALGAAVWDSRTGEHRMIERRDGAPGLAAALGRGAGEVLWIDEDSEAWFLARRPAFFNVVQGAPVLFSRELALAWAARGRRLRQFGLIHAADVAPWSAPASGPAEDIALTPDALTRFCADPDRPAALVAPGAQLAAVPPALSARLWRPPAPVRRLSIGNAGFRWRVIDTYTVVTCAGVADRGHDVVR